MGFVGRGSRARRRSRSRPCGGDDLPSHRSGWLIRSPIGVYSRPRCARSPCTTRSPARCCRCAPREPGKVGIYVCGPTVYGRIHIGNARPFVVFSLLKRFLVHEGYEVTFVANVTDVNDKIYAAATAAGIDSAMLAQEMTAHYVADTDGLGLGRPDHEPLASETIAEIVASDPAADRARSCLRGRRRRVLRRSSATRRYGELSHRRLEDLDQGEGKEGADRKRDPFDFALWKAQKPGEDTAWDAPWGAAGRVAHRVLGDGREAARARLRDPRRRLGSDLPPPRERGRPDLRRTWACRSRACGFTTAWCGSTARRWPSRSATPSCCTRRLTPTAATR